VPQLLQQNIDDLIQKLQCSKE